MLDYVKENFGNRPGINEAERMELEFLRNEVPKLRVEVYGKNVSPGAGTSTASDKGGDDSQSESEGDEFVDDLPMALGTNKGKGPRQSVSAEVFGKFNK